MKTKFYFLFFFLSYIQLSAQNSSFRSYEFLELPTITIDNKVLRAADRAPVMIFDSEVKPSGNSPKSRAENYIYSNWNQYGFKQSPDAVLKFNSHRKMNSGHILRYRQYHKGIRVDKNEMMVKLSNHNEVSVFYNYTLPIYPDFPIVARISADQAQQTVENHLDIKGVIQYLKKELMIHTVRLNPVLCWQVNIIGGANSGDWEAYVNAFTGELIEVSNISEPYIPDSHVKSRNIHNTVNFESHYIPPNFASLGQGDGTGNIFVPAPTVSAQKTYNTGGFVDGGDSNNPTLEAEMMEVVLQDITEENGVCRLIGPNAEVIDGAGTYDNNGPNFLFNRSDPSFEAVMCYFYLDQSMRYVNDNLLAAGSPIGPTAGGGVRFNPHDPNQGNNARFQRATEFLLFGDGVGNVVDAAEDATIIYHEFGHAIHFWLTDGNPQNLQGLGEGLADYWGASNNRDCNNAMSWDEWEPEYHTVGHWGLLPAILQRTTDFNNAYDVNATSSPLPGQTNHDLGQHISTPLMRIYGDIGKEKTDILLIESMPLLNTSRLNQVGILRQAGAIIYRTAVELEEDNTISPDFTENDVCIIFKHLEDKLQISQSTKPGVIPPTGGDGDIYIKDTPCDNGTEVNPDGGSMWNSKDIWVRVEDDGELEHENGEYKENGDPNFVYVRVRGLGCTEVTDAKLHVYWSKAGLQLDWPDSWNDHMINGPNGVVLAGDELTNPVTGIAIPTIAPGEEVIFKIPWVVPNPYDFDTEQHHFCLLARIVSIQDDMHKPEGIRVNQNTRNNNNIAWKNMSIFDEVPGMPPPPISVYVGCDSTMNNAKLKLVSPQLPLGKTIHDYGQIYLELKEPLFTDWLATGGKGTSFSLLPNDLIRVDDEGFELDSLPLHNCDQRVVDVHFIPDSTTEAAVFDLVQYSSTGEVIGGERFAYQANPAGPDLTFRTVDKEEVVMSQWIQLYPNPATDNIAVQLAKELPDRIWLQIYSVNGHLVEDRILTKTGGDEINIDITNYMSGLYILNINDKTGRQIDQVKFVKL